MFKDKYKNILIFILYVFSKPKLFLVAMRCHLPTYIQLEWLKNWNIKTFIDVGAHEGQEIKAISVLFPKARIYAFEPQMSLFKKIEHLSNHLVSVINLAVGEGNFKTSIGIPKYSPAASILTPTQELSKEFGDFSAQSVFVTSLDNYFKSNKLQRPVALKIDTQGYEFNVLKGASKFLSEIDIIYVETSLSTMYIGSALFEEIFMFLTKKGFVYHGAIADSQFWPQFLLPSAQNSIFIRKTNKQI